MANRIFDLPETRGNFQVKGIVSGAEKDRFYTEKKTQTGKDFRAVNFGCEYNDKQTIYMNLNGMPQQDVHFSKKNQNTGKTETKKVAWANRNKFNEEGWRMIGVNLGLVKTTDKDGKSVNDKKTMHAFDACEYIKKNLNDDMSTFVRGTIDFSSYTDKEGNVRRSVKYVPNQISLCKDVDFCEYNDVDNKPVHDFTQTIVFIGVDKEKENDKDTGRFVVSAKIVTWSDIVDTEFIITFFVLFVDEILLVIDTKILKLARDINREYVGEISDNKVIPLIPSVLVYIIFIIVKFSKCQIHQG